MDKIEKYRKFIKEILSNHAHLIPDKDDVKAELIYDNETQGVTTAVTSWQGNPFKD